MGILVQVPSEVLIRQDSWRLPDPRVIQRSEFTRRSRELYLGAAAIWSCEAEIVTRTAAELYPVRGFVASMMLPDAFCVVPMYPAGGQLTGFPGQISTPVQVDGAGQLGLDLAVRGLPPGSAQALPGFAVTFGSVETHILRATLIADGTGRGVCGLTRPIRQSPPDGTDVHLRFPFCFMRLTNGLAWQNAVYQLHEIPPLQFEEYF
ncbi:hypothetical protein [Sandarakinorhabdus sp.]|uniref:hypothetical protein n=1 Tax=Sandarakinorhabdus sp. TaxID=1916663 RepID=UPI00286E5172|nr:hypothetical protein [Sandarakinorhabdus sp.]